MIELLTIRAYIENEGMRPWVRKRLPDLEDDVLESYEEHHVADLLGMELVASSPDAERFNVKQRAAHSLAQPSAPKKTIDVVIK